MASITLTCSADVTAISTPSNIAAGAGVHLPIGTWQGYNYRVGLRFTKPSWSGWAAVTKAVLEVYTSDTTHVGNKSSTIDVRQTSSTPWTAAEGTKTCELLGANSTLRSHLVPTNTNAKSFVSGTAANAKKSIDVTAMVQWYKANNQNPVFILDGDASNYAEIWSRSKSSTYAPKLVITYSLPVVTPPPGDTTPPPDVPPTEPDVPVTYPPEAPPAGTGDPPTGGTVLSQTPTLTWVNNSVLPVTQTEVQVLNADSSQVVWSGIVTGEGESVVVGMELPRGHQYWWQVRQTNPDGTGPWSTPQVFMVADNPKPTVTSKYLAWSNGPRVVVTWTNPAGSNVARYRVTWDGYDSGWISGAGGTHRADTFDVVGVANLYNMQVHVEDANGLQGRSDLTWFNPKYGLTTHRKDLQTVPTGWGQVGVDAVTNGGTVFIEFGSSRAADPAPEGGWRPSLGSVPRAQFLFYRVWLLPSPAGASPVIRLITIGIERLAMQVDDWLLDGGNPNPRAQISLAEYVYGTRSIEHVNDGAPPLMVTTSLVSVRLLAGRSYILTGLMKSQGDSGAKIVLLNGAKDAILTETQTLHETRDWTQPDTQDNYRYASQVFTPQADMDAWVELRTEGAAGTAAWFDAVKLEESTVATPWSPGMIGASVLDAGGVQIDGTKGGVFRYRGRDGNIRSMVEGGPSGLVFAGDTEITSPADGQIAVDGTRVSLDGHTHAGAGLQTTTTIPRGTDATEGAELVLEAAPAGTEWHIDTHGDDLRIFHTPDANPVVVRAGDIILPGNQSISALIARIAALEAAGGGSSRVLTYIPTNRAAIINAGAGKTAVTDVEITNVPASTAAFIQLVIGVRRGDTNNASIDTYHYDGRSAGVSYTGGVASRGSIGDSSMVIPGGANGRTVKYKTTNADDQVYVWCVGYWAWVDGDGVSNPRPTP